jgi:hypothetical protein
MEEEIRYPVSFESLMVIVSGYKREIVKTSSRDNKIEFLLNAPQFDTMGSRDSLKDRLREQGTEGDFRVNTVIEADVEL